MARQIKRRGSIGAPGDGDQLSLASEQLSLAGDQVSLAGDQVSLDDDQLSLEESAKPNAPSVEQDAGGNGFHPLFSEEKRKKAGPKSGRPFGLAERQLFFDLACTKDYYPLQRISKTSIHSPWHCGSSQYVQSIDLGGIEQITDMFFYTMRTQLGADYLQHVIEVKCSGCQYITDYGVRWLFDLLSEDASKELTFHGCKDVSMFGVRWTRAMLQWKIFLGGTNTSFIHPDIQDEDDGLENIQLPGCPLISPAIVFMLQDFEQEGFRFGMMCEPVRTIRTLVINTHKVKHSLVALLSGNSEKKLTKPLEVLDGCSLGVPDGYTFNVMQCQQEMLDDIMGSGECCVYVLPVNMDDDLKTGVKAVVDTMLHILYRTNAYGAVFMLVGMTTQNGQKSGLELFLQQNIGAVQSALAAEIQVMNSSLKTLDFGRQQLASRMCAVYESLDTIQERLTVVVIDPTTDEAKCLLPPLRTCAKAMQSENPMYSVIFQTTRGIFDDGLALEESIITLKEFKKKMSNTPRMLEVQRMIAEGLDDDSSDDGEITDMVKGFSWWKVAEIMHMLGHVLYFPDVPGAPIVLKKEKLADVINSWYECEKTPVGEAVQYMMSNTLVSSSGQLASRVTTTEVSQKELLVNIVQNTGMALKIPSQNATVLFKDLSAEVPPSLEMLWPKEVPSEDQEIMYGYQFNQQLMEPLFCSVLKQVVELFDETRKLSLLWKRGFLIQDGLIDVYLTWDPTADMQLRLAGRTVASLGDTRQEDSLQVKRCLWNIMEQYKLVVDYVLCKAHIYHKVTVMAGGPRPGGIVGAFWDHLEADKDKSQGPDSDRGPTESPQCKICGMSRLLTAKLWQMYKYVMPTFVTQVQIGDTTKNREPKYLLQNVITSDRGSRGTVQLTRPMSTWDFNQVSVTVIEVQYNKMRPLITLSQVEDENIGLKYDSSAATITVTSTPEETGQVITNEDAFSPREWDTIDVTLSDIDQVDKLQVAISINKVPILAAELPQGRYHVSFDYKSATAAQLGYLSAPRAVTAAVSKIPDSLVVGMKLEAWDTRTPSYVCCATIDDVIPEKQLVHVHFDKWKGYDYWIEATSKYLHPIGYMATKGRLHRQYEGIVQPPKGFEPKTDFKWDVYLKDSGAMAVPFSWFSQEQTESMNQVFPDEPGLAVKMHSLPRPMGQCSKATDRPEVLKNNILSKNKDIDLITKGFSDLYTSTPPPCLLPSPLDVSTLLRPNRKIMQDISKMDVHYLCSPSNLETHFVNCRALGLQSTFKNLVTVQMVSCIRLINNQYLLPKTFDKIVTGDHELTAVEAERSIQKLLSLWMQTLAMLDPSLASGVTDSVRVTEQGTMSWAPETQQALVSQWQRSELETKIAEFMTKTEDGYLCPAHTQLRALASKSDSSGKITESLIMPYANNIRILKIQHTHLTTLPQEFFIMFVNLVEIDLSHNALLSLPEQLGKCEQLHLLNVSHNQLSKLPVDLDQCADTLILLDISNNPFAEIPVVVFSCTKLHRLLASNMCLRDLPEEVGHLVNLKELNIAGSMLQRLPAGITKLSNIESLDLSGVRWLEGHDQPSSVLTFQLYFNYVHHCVAFKSMDQKKVKDMFSSLDTFNRGTLGFQEIHKLNAHIFRHFPRLGHEGNSEYGGFPIELLTPPKDEPTLFPKLRKLNLSFQAFVTVPPHIGRHKMPLEELDLSYNPRLESLAGELAHVPLTALHLKNCPSLKTPPKEIVGRGFQAIMGYLKRLAMGSTQCKRTKLMLVGLGGAGKTSLVQALTSSNYKTRGTQAENITDGIDITTWDVKRKGEEVEVTFSIWDFAGQTVYYNTHQFFLSNRAVYLLLWNVRLGSEHAGLDFWLNSVACHAPKAPVFVVGTHCDKVEKASLPAEDMQKRYQQIAGFHYVSSFTGLGIEGLVDQLVTVTLQEKYMGESIPKVWLQLETDIAKKRSTASLLDWSEVMSIAEQCGIIEEDEVTQAVQLLHDLGSLQHFDNEYLKSRVVIDPQWIVDVMACVVSVHDRAIKDGKFYRKDLELIWQPSTYPKELHLWLLRLTEEFDLTFPLKDEEANLVPCLLPDKEPEYEWPKIGYSADRHENKMLYQFVYLPAGLFNRAQVRLYQFSDSSVIWKKGSLLRKNGHMALLQALRDNNVLVRVQGPRPENILFMVHEVFEGLVSESFHGVQYDYLIPCTDCLKVGMLDPCMLPASRLRRAVEMKAPFVQCYDNFHTLSITELQSALPPDSSQDFDMQLQRTMQDLKDLRRGLPSQLFMVVCESDCPKSGQEDWIDPKKIREDLQRQGLNVQYHVVPAENEETSTKENLEEVITAMTNAEIVLMGVSNNFVANTQCCRLFTYSKETLRKNYLMVLMGERSFEWQKSDLGALVAGEVFINMQDPKRYEPKWKELMEALASRFVSLDLKEKDYAPCFISYCWANSKDAVTKGTKTKSSESVGWADPRQLKQSLEERGVPCWMDIEQVGRGGLFEDIAEGLRQAKVMVACISDEYVNSKNCSMEFRFASISLKIPIIVAVVGSGYKWIGSEIGMLSMGTPHINFQFENPAAYDELAAAVKDCLPTDFEEQQEAKAAQRQEEKQKSQASRENAYNELIELAERKFVRQLAAYVEGTDLVGYPRVLLMDFLKPSELKKDSDKYLDEQRQIARELAEQRKREYEEQKKLEAELKKQEADKAQQEPQLRPKTAGRLRRHKSKSQHESVMTSGSKDTAPPPSEQKKHKSKPDSYLGLKAEHDADSSGDETGSKKKSLVKEATKGETTKDGEKETINSGEGETTKDKEGETTKDGEGEITKDGDKKEGDEKKKECEGEDRPEEEEWMDPEAAMRHVVDDRLPIMEVAGQKLGFRFMCEHEGGWHLTDTVLIWRPSKHMGDLVESWAPYMARILAILRYSNMDLQVFATETGQEYIRYIEKMCASSSDFQSAYLSLRRMVKEVDTDKTMGTLSRCHLPSGKVIWLCPEHQNQSDRITVMNTGGGATASSTENTGDITMVELIDEMQGVRKNTQARGMFIGAALAVQTANNYEKRKQEAPKEATEPVLPPSGPKLPPGGTTTPTPAPRQKSQNTSNGSSASSKQAKQGAPVSASSKKQADPPKSASSTKSGQSKTSSKACVLQ